MSEVLTEARVAYERRDWSAARDGFTVARAQSELGTPDLRALSDAAWWLGRNEEALAVSEQVYRRHLDDAQLPQAAMLALNIGFLWMLRGAGAIASGWFSRARRLLDDLPEGAAHGHALSLDVEEALAGADFDVHIDPDAHSTTVVRGASDHGGQVPRRLGFPDHLSRTGEYR